MKQLFNIISETELRLDNSNYELRKYKILEKINSLNADTAKQLKRILPSYLGVTKQTWANWLNASISDKLEIPSVKLAIIAKYLNSTIEDLFNIQIPTIVLENQNLSQEKQILKQTGLTI